MCANTLGRKRTIQLGSLIAAFGLSFPFASLLDLSRRVELTLFSLLRSSISGCALQTGARSIGMLIGGRFVAGE